MYLHQLGEANKLVNIVDECGWHNMALVASEIPAKCFDWCPLMKTLVEEVGLLRFCLINIYSEWVNDCTQPINYTFGLEYKTHPLLAYRVGR